jgi:hypothetical protein
MAAPPVRTPLLRVVAGLWAVWGLVHLFAGVASLAGTTVEMVQAIADAVPDDVLAITYPDAVGGILDQHAWNLGWFGAATIVGAVLIWRGNRTAIWVTAMVGGLADVGYLLFLDVPGYVNVVPGTIMTVISATAIALSGWVVLQHRRAGDRLLAEPT